ncbi:unnamed protein product [Cylindrotheca closterium]|uniref:Guanylate cyclase domain-containing protein n=1 Tax=Cylindrotheca closterium TaxID=2856 RepID=A0AAD2CN02_9STRA|nr:unnamed protein product [Cylindrotheca closterium]
MDGAFDTISLVVFGFFILDMIIRVMIYPTYFSIGCCNTSGVNGGNDIQTGCVIGSFVFWCDLVSTITLLYDISWINKDEYSVREIEIQLNEFGIPIAGVGPHSRLGLGEVEIELLLTIARTARVVRFIRSRTVVNMSNKVNWYWAFEKLRWLDPFYCRRKLRKKKKPTQRNSLGMATEHNPRAGMGTAAYQRGISAAVQVREEMEARQARESSKRWSVMRVLQTMGLRDSDKGALSENEAAKRIQRAWRKHFKAGQGSYSSESSDLPDTGSVMGGNSRKSGTFRIASSRFQQKSGTLQESQVGSDMRELTGQRVALGVLFSLVFTVLFTYTEPSTTTESAMIVLHNQTRNLAFERPVLNAAKDSSVPHLFKYKTSRDHDFDLPLTDINGNELKERDQLVVTVIDPDDRKSIGWFSNRRLETQKALTSIVATFFIIIIWFVGMSAFAGPVMVLVVTPIERMVRLLGMLMLDPLGYQSTTKFKKFLREEDALIQGTRWTKKVLRGMETSFLMSTILRIGSLMKVGFGGAGVEIIRNNLQKGQTKNVLILSSQGSTVSCIFLFCDIRQFTNATESLQEEVFVFTNRIAAVVHSICHSYGGAANKNVGDAFLLSWSLEDPESSRVSRARSMGDSGLRASKEQADKALLAVTKISQALYYDKFYLEPLSEVARARLKEKLLKKKTGPVVKMGFGLHAGKAVQGAIGSQRKIDATYVSEAVNRAEFLESETKTYGLQLLMSGIFHSLLTESTKRRCRKIDQVYVPDDDDEDDEDDGHWRDEDELIHLHTFDMDISAIYRTPQPRKSAPKTDMSSDGGSSDLEKGRNKRLERVRSNRNMRNRRRSSLSLRPSGRLSLSVSEEVQSAVMDGASVSSMRTAEEPSDFSGPQDLVLPRGPAIYNKNAWLSPEMKRMREKYVQGLFFQNYAKGLKAFYNKDWDTAKQCFQTVLNESDDGPSRHFLKRIKECNGVPPKDFVPYRKMWRFSKAMDTDDALGPSRESEDSALSKVLLILLSSVIAILVASVKWKHSFKLFLIPNNNATKAQPKTSPPTVPFILIRKEGDVLPSRKIRKSMDKYKSDTYHALKGLSQQMDQAIELEHGLSIHQGAKLSTKIQRRIQKLSDIFDHNEKIIRSLLAPMDFITSLPDNGIIQSKGEMLKRDEEVYSESGQSNPNYPNPSTLPHSSKQNATNLLEENVYDMTAQIIAHLVRDWSAAGSNIRESLYLWVCRELVKRSRHRQDPVLVPGAGMGRLAYDIYSLGFTVEANEISPVMAAAAKSILIENSSGLIYPYALDAMSNEVESSRRYDKVSFPDVPVVHLSEKFSLSFTIGDFAGAYYSTQASTFGAVTTCFFIDTATDIYEYIALIKGLLKPKGIWINVGPVQWHANALLRPSADELKDLLLAFGFTIITWSIDNKPVPYRHDSASDGSGRDSFVRSTSFEGYRPLRFVAIREY